MRYNDFNQSVFNVIPNSARILDIGCAGGLLGKEIRAQKRPRFLAGIEIDKDAAGKASTYYDKVEIIDLQKTINLPFKKRSFDVIVLGDVIEHLTNAAIVLKTLKAYLTADGVLIVSVPNVLFVLNRFKILFGRFDYTKTGIMDETHVHFYTWQSICNLIKDSGYRIEYRQGYFNTRKSLAFLSFFARWFPGLFAYQFLLVCKRA